MRPVVGDGQARSNKFRIGFDTENAEVIRLVGREISDLRVRRFTDLTRETKQRIRAHYARIAAQMPKDPAAVKYIQIIDQSLGVRPIRP